MLKYAAFVAALAAVAVCMPADLKVVPKQRDNCGAVTIVKKYINKPSNANSAVCEFCLDLIEIAETYEECEEAIIEHKLESDCDKKFDRKTDLFANELCRRIVDDVAHDVIQKTEDQNPEQICNNAFKKQHMKTDCHFDSL